MSHPTVTLRPRADRRLRNGHPWVFSNEIADDVGALPPGGTVDVLDAKGAFLARGTANPQSLIAVRVLTRNRREDIDNPTFFVRRIREALAHREAILPDRTSYRLVHAEGDKLPGLVVDRFGDVLSVQITSLGLEHRKHLLQQALQETIRPAGAVLRGASRGRELEGLPPDSGVWFGEVPETIDIDEYGIRYRIEPLGGQKTGHFFDQAENRRLAATLCRGRSVLDVYAYNGGWALHALAGGATHAITVDRSEDACAQTLRNAELNGVADRLTPLKDEGKKALTELVGTSRRFGAVVVDPPAFAKTRKVVKQALKGYRDVNALAMTLVEPGGYLFASSCSHHVDEASFIQALHEAAHRAGRFARIVRRGEQAPDHPVVPGISETRYLKSVTLRLTPDT